MTKYPSLDRYLSPLSPIMCTAPPPPPIFLQPILNHQFQSFPNLYSYIPNFSSLYHFLSERKQASTIFAGFPRLFSEKRIRGKRGKWVRETKAQSNNEPGYTPSTSLFTREPLFRLSFFQGCRYESWSPVLVNRRWTTRCEHEQRSDGDRDPVYCLSWVPNYRNSLINDQVKRERQSERAADRR